ncbi:MAG: hypothetical protein QOH67_1254, partial [Hyphomicrobiales bacterium]|nr:hypothetical protein [Hyphomicrobiales bacterium]
MPQLRSGLQNVLRLLIALGAMLSAAPAAAQPEIIPALDVTWTVQPSFGSATEGRNNVSGVTCMRTPPSSPCLVVNDAAKFAQIFSVSGTTIQPGALVGFTTDPPPGLANIPNAEGAAHDDRFFYVVTSAAKTDPPVQVDTSFIVLRFQPDAAGRPPTATSIQTTQRVRDALTAGIPIPQISGARIDRANARIEGIAVKDNVLHLGFRAPTIAGKAFIASTPVATLFTAIGPLHPAVHVLALGPDTGIRDLAAVSDGILVLGGRSQGLPGPATLFHWNPAMDQLRTVASLVQPVDKNP